MGTNSFSEVKDLLMTGNHEDAIKVFDEEVKKLEKNEPAFDLKQMFRGELRSNHVPQTALPLNPTTPGYVQIDGYHDLEGAEKNGDVWLSVIYNKTEPDEKILLTARTKDREVEPGKVVKVIEYIEVPIQENLVKTYSLDVEGNLVSHGYKLDFENGANISCTTEVNKKQEPTPLTSIKGTDTITQSLEERSKVKGPETPSV